MNTSVMLALYKTDGSNFHTFLTSAMLSKYHRVEVTKKHSLSGMYDREEKLYPVICNHEIKTHDHVG